jgi:dTDP-4-dehydrorhamnose 3,5-epimerase
MEKIEHKTFKDNRGSYTPVSTKTLGIDWTQCSISVNDKQYTFRGLHYQTIPRQTKYIKVIKGSIVDFALDLETKELETLVLGENDAVLIPNDKAHGFLTLVPDTIVLYLSEGEYNPEHEYSIPWWRYESVVFEMAKYTGNEPLILSDKDRVGKEPQE